MSFFVDAQQAIRAAISDLEEEGFGTEELREVADALADLIEAAQSARTSLQHMRGPDSIIHAVSAELDAALLRIKGGSA
ncbi:hypothetical protein D7T48_12170 [Stenotrophomonas maltophilia]|uniref:hypothetical protein n=1 Tax=Stenotrophomonas maltophilia TaxID=40324 RepID=UPI0015DEA5C5|nr:hypothetical protein [Stenotrophomonas maltophilia]MBA0277544.1 hypothetical protein [Stenotrophomonas maltophilia]MBA0413017.1 hypothetical protein [Stenotrophomonas maltophilia]MBA0498677.1 hypothetical protein [Stenotrophomonas maltophilia]MBA0502829.1 hypothetical protein [Stenotrophomonas maltophilia]MBA0507730.1 hypothetical protein [Stenotrophomonas maltophilia]